MITALSTLCVCLRFYCCLDAHQCLTVNFCYYIFLYLHFHLLVVIDIVFEHTNLSLLYLRQRGHF